MPGEELTVLVGHDGPDTIDATVSAIETTGSFDVVLENRSGPAHVHCRLEGDLSGNAAVDGENHYVEADRERRVPVVVETDGDVLEGSLELSTGYGSAATTVDVTVTPPESAVEVDETLSRPQTTEPEPTPLERAVGKVGAIAGLDPAALAVFSLGALALGLGAATAAIVGGAVAILGVLVVSVGVAVAVVTLLW